MNKRQRKKQFKKNYGVNPDQAINIINDALSNAIPKAADVIKKWANDVVLELKLFPQKVKDMPEREFLELLNNENLSSYQKLILIKLRDKEVIDI